MRILLMVLMVGTLAWSVYWVIGQIGVSEGFEAWFYERRDEGWVAEYDALETKGFPNRFDTSFTNVGLADPDTGLAWEAPFFQILALSYRPNHVIAVWPKEQLIATPLDKFAVQSEDMRASVLTGADLRLPLERLTLTAESVAVTAVSSEQTTTLQSLRVAAERKEPSNATYRLGVAAEGLSPALDWRVQLDPAGKLPDQFEALTIDLTVEFHKPWDLSAIEVARPQPRKIELTLADARWGRLELQAAGRLDVDAQGTPEGDIVLKARNWREILQMAVSSGTLEEGFAETLESGLSLISQMAGNPETLDIPLRFSGGRVWVGPVPLGKTPTLVLR